MRRIFIDTSAFVALRNSTEKEHSLALETLRTLIADGVQLFTSNYIFSETYTALLVRVGRREAITWGKLFRESTTIDRLIVDDEVDDAAWEILERYSDKRYSHVDATSFALMERHKINEAFALDHHFSQAGYVMVPN